MNEYSGINFNDTMPFAHHIEFVMVYENKFYEGYQESLITCGNEDKLKHRGKLKALPH